MAIFMILCYFLNYHPTNKLELAMRRHQAAMRRNVESRELARPRAIRTTLFLARDDYATGTAFLSYDPSARTATVSYKSQTFTYNVDSETDKRMLIPILLLSK